MTNARVRLPRITLWLAIAVVGALTGVALQVGLPVGPGGSDAGAPVRLVAIERAAATSDGAASVTDTAAAPVTRAAAAPLPRAGDTDGQQARPLEGEPASGVVSAAAPDSGFVLRIPALGVDARIVTLGVTPAGQLDVPHDGASVGWYDISARPGEPGSALLGAHFDWDGALAVFGGLSRLSAGDLVYVDDGSGELAYEVTLATSVGWEHPVAGLLSSDGSGSSLTMFTCGGSFDTARGEYEQRVIVRAERLESSNPFAARR